MSNISEVQNYIGALMRCYGVAIDEDTARYQCSLQAKQRSLQAKQAISFVQGVNENINECDVREVATNLNKEIIIECEKERFSRAYRHVFNEIFGIDRTKRSICTCFGLKYVLDCVKNPITGQEVIYLTFYDDKVLRSVYKTNP